MAGIAAAVLRAVDLFAGAGGATRGLRDAGFDVVAAVENDKSAAETWRLNHDGVLFERDIRQVDVVDLAAVATPEGMPLDLLKSCAPCQGFSSLRGGRTPDARRNDLVLDTLRFVDGLEPRAVLLENVPGLRRDPRFTRLIAALRERDYAVADFTVEASTLGVPQRRRRLVVLAVQGDVDLPGDVDGLVAASGMSGHATAGEALAGLRAALAPGDKWHRWRKSSEPVALRIAAVPVGGTRFDLPAEHQLACHQRLVNDTGADRRVAMAAYGRVRAEHPAPTMTTRCTTPACGSFIHPTEHRGLSLREAAALQTFPPDYQWFGGYDSVERQIGNAVPVRLAEALGRVVAALLTPEEQRADRQPEAV